MNRRRLTRDERDQLRAQAVDLRLQGLSYAEISGRLDVSKGSLSPWLRELVLTTEQRAALALRRPPVGSGGSALHLRRLQSEQRCRDQGISDVGDMTARELFLVGAALYWAEGVKPKPWNPSVRMCLMNSDPSVIDVFIRWLALIGVSRDRILLQLHIHESADLDDVVSRWRERPSLAGLPWGSATVKRHNPLTRRHNVGEDYLGCLRVTVNRSTELVRTVAGWWAGIAAVADLVPLQGAVPTDATHWADE
jgi:hypothetical protein